MALLSLLEQLYDMPQRMSYSQFVKVRQDIRNHPDYHTIKDEFEQTYTKETGSIFAGADYSALEDKINTLLTGDPNKVKVYSEGFDSHCFRTYYYWKDQMPDIQQANEDEQCFKLTLEDGSELTVKASDTLIYQGKETTAQELLQNML